MAVVTAPTPSSPDPDPSQQPSPGGGGRPGAAAPHSGGHRPPAPHAGARTPAPDYEGADLGPGPLTPSAGFNSGPLLRRELRDAALWGLAVAVAGVVLGLLWLWLAPRVPLVNDGRAVYLKDPEGEEAMGADGTFVLLGLAFGVVSGLVVFLFRRSGGVGLVVGLAVGGLLGSVLAWRLGVWLGPDTDLVAAAKAAGKGATFDGPLKLQAKGALLAWPLLAVGMHLLLTALFGKHDPDPYDDYIEGPPRIQEQ